MKVLVTSTGSSLQDRVDPRFGRAAMFILYDTDTDEFSVIDNTAGVDASHGAGVSAGQRAADSGAQAVVTGNCGPKAYQVLAGAGINVYSGADGTVAEALEQLKAGTLKQAEEANVGSHFGV